MSDRGDTVLATNARLNYADECQAPHPGHSSGRCERWRNDAIHGPSSECEEREGTPCTNPAAHHKFLAERPA